MTISPSLHVFDAYGTLFDVNSAVARSASAIGSQADRLAETWRSKQLEYTWTYALMGRYPGFRALTAAALDVAATICGGLPAGMREILLSAYDELDAYPDVVPTLRALRAKGARTAILSNGSSEMLETATRAAGLCDLLDAVISVDEVRTFKTAPIVYDLVGRRLGTRPGEVVFVSSNRWDVAGARAFGFSTAWVNRTDKPDEYLELPPDRVVTTLAALV